MYLSHILGVEPEDYYEQRERDNDEFIELADYIKGKERANDRESESIFNPQNDLQNKIIH